MCLGKQYRRFVFKYAPDRATVVDSRWIFRGMAMEWLTFCLMLFAWVPLRWLQANTAYQRLGVTAQLLAEAKLSFQLAQARYRVDLSSIVELSQA